MTKNQTKDANWANPTDMGFHLSNWLMISIVSMTSRETFSPKTDNKEKKSTIGNMNENFIYTEKQCSKIRICQRNQVC